MYDDKFSLYKGAYCNFNNDVLDGTSSFFTATGKKKIESSFNKGKCIVYNSYDNTGNIITKITGKEGLVNNKVIINGTLKEFDGNNLIWLYSIECIGEIYAEFERKEHDLGLAKSNQLKKEDGLWNISPEVEDKRKYDSLLSSAESITVIKKLFGIPYFYIKRFDFDNFDKDDMAFIPINSNCLIDSEGLHPVVYEIKKSKDNLFYLRNPFFSSNDVHSTNILNNSFWESTIDKSIYSEDGDQIMNDRSFKFNNWLKEVLHFTNLGSEDELDYSSNNNQEIALFLKSYSDSILSFCFALNRGDLIPSFINPCIANKYGTAPYSSVSDDFSENRFVINSISGRYLFCLRHRENKESLILWDRKNKIVFGFERVYDGPIGNSQWNDWEFKIANESGTELYYSCAGDGANREQINRINDDVKSSLKDIYDTFH